MPDYDVIVVGAGNAALAASVAARNAGAERVLVLEKAPEAMRGGNTHYSGGLLRIAFERVEEILHLVPKARELPGFVEGIEAYPRDAFMADLKRMTANRTDPELAETLVANSYATASWMAEQGIRFEPAISLGAVRVGNLIKWPKGAIIRAVHEGVGLSRMWFTAAERKGVTIRYGAAATRLVLDGAGRVCGVAVRDATGFHEVVGRAIVLGCGGFEANAAWRAQYLGRPWDHAKVRGTPHNQGDGLRMACEIGAMPWGQWSGCHATPINAAAPPFGDRQLTDKTNRLSYPYGVMINRAGLRFVDEGEDQAFFTYAKFGGIILNQPGGVAYQIFASKVRHLLEPRYATSDPIEAPSLAELVDRLEVDREAARRTLEEYNAAAGEGPFNPGDRDGLATRGLALGKSNWAQRLDTPPFLAWPVTGGITFSFGGLKINDRAQVVGTNWEPIAGLYACGEMVGGLFHSNYPGGSGLMSGAVFGRIAGASAALDGK
ncbi:MAG TPA: FAD-dependent tricarballylate dehydrogenase TcuA [Candidatus Binataceae bacterium]|nr:FAD-dependent tricarballylate dehydrogenase TcuA [Candidatus Binataceae bacterium]